MTARLVSGTGRACDHLQNGSCTLGLWGGRPHSNICVNVCDKRTVDSVLIGVNVPFMKRMAEDQSRRAARLAKIESDPNYKRPRPKPRGPGDLVKIVLDKMGYASGFNCGCRQFSEKMNRWGWRGCVRNRREIIEWFTAKAKEQKIPIEGGGVWSLIRAGLKDLYRKSSKE